MISWLLMHFLCISAISSVMLLSKLVMLIYHNETRYLYLFKGFNMNIIGILSLLMVSLHV